MANSQIVQARINKEIKEEASVVLASLGLTVSDVIRIILTKVAHEKSFPAELLISNKETLQAIKDVKKGNVHTAHTLDDFFKELNDND